MNKKHGKYHQNIKKKEEGMTNSAFRSRMQHLASKFDESINKPYSIYCYPPWLSLSIRPVKSGVSYFIVSLREPLTKKEVEARMVIGFGNLGKNKETT